VLLLTCFWAPTHQLITTGVKSEQANGEKLQDIPFILSILSQNY